ncbi:hypothetical protein BD413DRAFT_612357 [Trametes elegans]|nr:hypothetical protein BD413DRAFT_612357 [Trametes elegans]
MASTYQNCIVAHAKALASLSPDERAEAITTVRAIIMAQLDEEQPRDVPKYAAYAKGALAALLDLEALGASPQLIEHAELTIAHFLGDYIQPAYADNPIFEEWRLNEAATKLLAWRDAKVPRLARGDRAPPPSDGKEKVDKLAEDSAGMPQPSPLPSSSPAPVAQPAPKLPTTPSHKRKSCDFSPNNKLGPPEFSGDEPHIPLADKKCKCCRDLTSDVPCVLRDGFNDCDRCLLLSKGCFAPGDTSLHYSKRYDEQGYQRARRVTITTICEAFQKRHKSLRIPPWAREGASGDETAPAGPSPSRPAPKKCAVASKATAASTSTLTSSHPRTRSQHKVAPKATVEVVVPAMMAEVHDHPVVSLLPSQSTDVTPSLKGSQRCHAKPAVAPVSSPSPLPAVPADLNIACIPTAEEEALVAHALDVEVEMNTVTPPPPSPSAPRMLPPVPALAPSSLPFVALPWPPSADRGASVLEDPKVLPEPKRQNYLTLSSCIRELEVVRLVLGWEIKDLRRRCHELVEPYTVTVPLQDKGKGRADAPKQHPIADVEGRAPL